MKAKLSPSKIKQIIEEKDLAKSDSRFSHVFKDPRYRNHQRQASKTLLDSRFQRIAKDESFYRKPTMDPHGQPETFLEKKNLMNLYRLSSSESEDQDSENDTEDSVCSESEIYDENIIAKREKIPKVLSEKELSKKMLDMENDYAREAFFSDSSDDDSSSNDDQLEDESDSSVIVDSDSDINEADVVESSRIAVLNANWDYLKASDIMMIFSSFATTSGKVNKVSIYLSNYGKLKIQEEEENGPQLFLSDENAMTVEYLDKLERGEVDDDGTLSDEQIRAFRKYQLRKLKYYYAVVECDSIETAVTIYKQCDKSSIGVLAQGIDLRYILDETQFDETPIEVCECTDDAYEYKSFDAFDIKQSMPWDETDPKRERIMEDVMKKAMKGETISENALKDYIGSGSSSEESGDNSEIRESKGKRRKRLRKLLDKIDEKGDLSDDDVISDDSEDDVHMTETFQVSSSQKLVNESEEVVSSEEQESSDNNDNTKLQLMLMDDNIDEGSHFNMRDVIKEAKGKIGRKKWEKMKINKKRDNAATEDNFKINTEDERFAMIHDGRFNIEWNHPSYKRTSLMDNLLKELPAKRRKHNEMKNGTV